MGQVLDERVVAAYHPKYRFRTNIFGKQVLQIGRVVQPWDTNTGHDDGPERTNWADATRYEAEDFMRGDIC